MKLSLSEISEELLAAREVDVAMMASIIIDGSTAHMTAVERQIVALRIAGCTVEQQSEIMRAARELLVAIANVQRRQRVKERA